MLKGKTVLLGVTGGIAAYKAAALASALVKLHAAVEVVMTKNATQFITPLTFEELTGRRVMMDTFDRNFSHQVEHISLAQRTDLMIVAPATANVCAKLAHGLADDMLTTTALACTCPKLIAPAMNTNMYESPATQQAMHQLAQWDNITMLDAASGELACGTSGKGRMQEIDVLLAATEYALTPKTLLGKHVLITAGPTHEPIDPVRYITNASTGKMGYALAQACLRRGAQVTLITGPSLISMKAWEAFTPITMLPVASAAQMCEAALKHFDQSDISILCAAVADFTPSITATQKIKKQPGQTSMTIEMITTTDIAATLGQLKRPNQTLIGFALETHDELANALRKLQGKNLDMIVLNSLQDTGAGFGTDTNKVTLLYANGAKKDLPLLSKQEVANQIIDQII
jgi:phosphopantothenoylcysteine decarboxylase/phosphopantothenate--cysteine ligase